MPRSTKRATAPIAPAPPEVFDDLSKVVRPDGGWHAAELEACVIADPDLHDVDATALQVSASRIERGTVAGAALRRASIVDAVVDRGDWANVDATEATITRVEFREVRLTGAVFTRGVLRDVVFAGCRLDLAAFRAARLERVRFDGCPMPESDLYEARLGSVVFDSCDLTRATLSHARFERSEMRRCDLEGVDDPTRLSGVGMPWDDVLRLAPLFARGVGVRILDDE